MTPVRDEAGNRYLLVDRSGDTCTVRDPATGERRSMAADSLEPVDASSLDVAASAVDDPVRRLLRVVHDDRSLGVLLELDARGPLAVRTLLAEYDYCESDLHGRLASWTMADLVETVEVGGERGYRVTDDCRVALDVLTER